MRTHCTANSPSNSAPKYPAPTRVYYNVEPSSKGGFHVHHFFLARLKTTDLTGPNISDPANGTYEVTRVSLHGDDLASFDLRPRGLKEYIVTNRQALLARVADMP